MQQAYHFIWSLLGAVSIFFHLFLVFSGIVPNLISRPTHMILALPWALLFVSNSVWEARTGIIFFIIGCSCCVWVILNEAYLSDQYGSLTGSFQLTIGGCLLIVVLEMARRSIGWPLPCVASVALLYGLFGDYIPGQFGHPGMPLSSFLGSLTITEGGLWGQLTGISMNVVAIFIILGAVLNSGDAGKGFINIAKAAAGKLEGGAAKVSVIASAFFGSISGSASANVASTGAITLPTMKKLNYPKSFAGAVEAVASSGGQIMPPLMGAGAFVMVELTGVPYSSIMQAAILPAILFFFAVWVGINCYARRFTLGRLPLAEMPKQKEIIISSLFFALPFFVLLWGMFRENLTPTYSASMAILIGAGLLLIDSNLNLNWERTFQRVASACVNSGRQIGVVASIILCASIIIGVLGLTGLGIKITSLIISASGGMMWPALVLTAIACLILGMEVPTTAAYIICISIAGPALINLGLEPLQAHMFVFWYALLSTITPPVCGTVFIAAGMVEEDWLKVAMSAMALGIGLYIIPLGMIANPELIKFSETPLAAIFAMIKVGIALNLISFSVIKSKSYIFRLTLGIIGCGILFV